MRSDKIAVVPRVEQQERHAGHVAVSQLECDTTLERLPIARACLGFDPITPSGAVDHSVPRPTIVRSGKRHLGSEPQGPMEPAPQPVEKGAVGSIAQWLATWIRTDAELETDG